MIHFFECYLTLNLLVVLAWLCSYGFIQLIKKQRIQSTGLLKIQYFLICFVFILSMTQLLIPKTNFLKPVVKIWSAPNSKLILLDEIKEQNNGYLNLADSKKTHLLQFEQMRNALISLLVLIGIFGSYYLCRDIFFFYKIKKNSFLLKKIKSVQIFIHHETSVPFSFWLPDQTSVVLPAKLVEQPKYLKLAIAHELQHHRQQDTKWIYFLWFIKLSCYLNPAIHLWMRLIYQMQELACDEAVLLKKNIDAKIYASCLFEVAKTALDQKKTLVSATGFLFLNERKFLTRRIESMFEQKKPRKLGRLAGCLLGATLASFIGIGAIAAKSLVQDRRVSPLQAQKMKIQAQSKTNFPIVVNERVLFHLNRYLGTPEGREFIKNSISRMKNYESQFQIVAQKYDVPIDILAIPIVESGYENLSPRDNPILAAGIWQFIASTAINYGLIVNQQMDERMDIDKETDAAMRYLKNNFLRFRDWQLAIMAYNYGEQNVQTGMDAAGTRNPWQLIGKGYEGDKDYLAKVMAVILILNNPETI